MGHSERIERIKEGQRKGLDFEDKYEQALKDMMIDYVRGHYTPWDFLIISPHSKTFIELKEGSLHLTKPQKKFMKNHQREYLIIVKKQGNYYFKHYDSYYGKPITEIMFKTDNIHKIAFYPVFRMIFPFAIFECAHQIMGKQNLFGSYVAFSFNSASKYVKSFEGMIPKEMGGSITLSPLILNLKGDKEYESVYITD